MFSDFERDAREKYERFVADGIAAGKQPDLIGGGLVRSAGGWHVVEDARRCNTFLKSDERILGDSDFVEAVLKVANEQMERRAAYKDSHIELEQIAYRVAEIFKVDADRVMKAGKHPDIVQARSVLCFWATRELGMTTTALGKRIGMSQPAVSRAAERGDELVKENGWQLTE
ncbi:hypothetical protein [Geomesophilobacter sediminis]|nr:hypothetical protein [Geomesophilobacter sediminis]